MKSKYQFTLFIATFAISLTNAQVVKDYNDNIDKYTLSSPDVYAFEKYSLNPVNHYVGKVDVSVPIYTIQTGNIVYPINLGYNTGGIKVDQLASDVGLGWTLSSALITRTINQANDFDNTGSLVFQPDYTTYSSTDQQQDFSAYVQNGYSGKIGYLLQKQTNRKIDLQHKSVDFLPDVYNFYSPSYATKFFFNDYNSVVEVNPKGTKINFTKGKIRIDSKRGYYSSTTPSVWTPNYNLLTHDLLSIIVTTNDGIKYTFSDCDFAINQRISDGYLPLDSPAQVSAWHITKIEDTKTGKKIDFIYDTTSSNPNYVSGTQFFSQGAQRSFGYVENPENNIAPGCSYYVPYTGFETYKLDITARVDVEKKRLIKIVFDEGEVNFNYNNQGVAGATMTSRNDLHNGSFISQIYVKDKNLTIIKTFNLSYNYFNSNYNVGEFNPDNILNTHRYNRLKLTDVQEIGKPKYKFTYEEIMKLPPVNSFSVDFLGYFNNSQDVLSTNVITSTRPNPTLYYYPNQFEKSLLPFPITGLSGQVIPGIFNRQANSYAKAWSLTKVEYPTGGSSEYVYEPNRFELFGQEILGGGIRVTSQLLNDGNGITRTINYTYTKDIGTTSGTLSSIPYFGHATTRLFDVTLDSQVTPPVILSPTPSPPFNTIDWKFFDKSNLNVELSSGSYIGYSKVTERENGKGRKERLFTSNDLPGYKNVIDVNYPQLGDNIYNLPAGSTCLVPFIITNSGLGSYVFTDNSYKRGKLLQEKVYNESNQILQTTTISYLDNLISSYSYYQGFTRPIHTQGENNLVAFVSAKKIYKISQFLPQNKTTIFYDLLGNNNSESYSYTYNMNSLLKTAETSSSIGDNKKTEYFYPNDVTSSLISLPGIMMTPSENTVYQYMATTSNNLSEIIQINDYTNNVLNSYKRKTFSITDVSTNIVSPEAIKIAKGTGALENRVKYDKYDDKKNVLQYTKANGMPVSMIWGYNKTELIAVIENVLYNNIPASIITNLQTKSNADNDRCKLSTCNEQLLRVALNNLRTNFPTAMITTYTHDPHVGMTSMTDMKGYTIYYNYDTLERLIDVKDEDGNIVKENQYNYKPQF